MKPTKNLTPYGVLSFLCLFCVSLSASRVEFVRDFAPSDGWVKPIEQPYRQEICLNGSWQFQPMPLPGDWKRGTGTAPELAKPLSDRWESTPIKIPSPWNVNTWGAGRNVGEGTSNPYWPSSVYFPSYPPHWDGVEMGWLRRSFRVPESWADCLPQSPDYAKFWRTLFANMGVRLKAESTQTGTPSKDMSHDLLLNGPPENKP